MKFRSTWSLWSCNHDRVRWATALHGSVLQFRNDFEVTPTHSGRISLHATASNSYHRSPVSIDYRLTVRNIQRRRWPAFSQPRTNRPSLLVLLRYYCASTVIFFGLVNWLHWRRSLVVRPSAAACRPSKPSASSIVALLSTTSLRPICRAN